MKVAHFSVFAPNRCGLYHTAKELVLAERTAGIDARFIAFNEKPEGKQKDGAFETEDIKWAYGADILVRHSAIPTHLQCAGIPIVIAMHGRPESSMRLESSGANPVLSAFYNKTQDERCKAFVTFWPEYVNIWSKIIPQKKLFYVPATVDLNEYNPDNKPFDLKQHKGSYNILISDIWRDDITPFNTLFSAINFAQKHKGVKIHIVGVPNENLKAMLPFFANMRSDGSLGFVSGQSRDIKSLYTSCDVLVTPHIIATRSIREALSSGLPVVAASGCKYTPYTANPMDVSAFEIAIESCYNKDFDFSPRAIAQNEFGFERAGKCAKSIFDGIINSPTGKQRKVLIDIGGHIGETVRRFYREVGDADKYDIYSFEPDMKTFKVLETNIGHIKNVNLVNACVATKDGIMDFYAGQQNQNEGGTLLTGKQTGGVDYQKPLKVDSVNFKRWLAENINDGDYVVLKMNIEGGEYDLMEMLLDENLTGIFDKIFIQLHSHKFKHGEQRFRFNGIEERFFRESKCKNLYFTNKGFYPFNAQ